MYSDGVKIVDEKSLLRALSDALWKRGELLARLGPGVIVDVTMDNLEDFIGEHEIALLYFTADWCGPCVAFYKTFKELAAVYASSKIAFGRVDVDRAYEVADKFNIRNIPSIAVFSNGSLVDVIVGQQPKEKLENKIEALKDAN